MITIDALSIQRASKSVISDLSISLVEGAVHGIVGLNGAGKTTLLGAIYGLIKPDAGKINRNGFTLSKKEVAYLETENFFYSNITGREYLSLFKNPLFAADKWNALFSLPLDQIVDNYSTGMKKKLALMAVLKQDKPLMILDEPFNGLDMETCSIIRTILLRFKAKGKTVLITSHIIETLTNLCDHIHYLESGKIKQSIAQDEFSAFENALQKSIADNNSKLISELMA